MTPGNNNTENVRRKVEEKLSSYFGVTPKDANIDQIYNSNTIKNKTDDNINNDNLIIVLYSKGQKIMFLLL